MELVFGFTCLVLGIAALAWAISDGRRAANWLLLTAVTVQLVFVSLLFADWGHSWVETSGISIALDRFAWLAFPHMLAVLTIVGILVHGERFRGWAGVLAMIQTGMLIVVMLMAERKVDLSFLAPVPLFSLFSSALASFAFFGSSLVVLPGPDSFWYTFVFRPRENLLNEIRSLEALGLDVVETPTLFECGSASGWMQGARIEVTTKPKIFPPRYGLQVRVSVQGTWHGQRLPRFASFEKWMPRAGWVEYHGLSDRAFAMEPGSLGRFIRELAGV